MNRLTATRADGILCRMELPMVGCRKQSGHGAPGELRTSLALACFGCLLSILGASASAATPSTVASASTRPTTAPSAFLFDARDVSVITTSGSVNSTELYRASIHDGTLSVPTDKLPPSDADQPRQLAATFIIGGKPLYMSIDPLHPLSHFRLGNPPRGGGGHLDITSVTYGMPGDSQDLTHLYRNAITDDRIGRNGVRVPDPVDGQTRRLEINARYDDVAIQIAYSDLNPVETLRIHVSSNGASSQSGAAAAAPAATTYMEPNVAAFSINTRLLKSPSELRARVATALAGDAAALAFSNASDLHLAEEMLGVALAVDPSSRAAVLTNARFKRNSPTSQSTARRDDALVADLMDLAHRVQNMNAMEDKGLAAILYDLCLQIAPGQEEAIFQSEVLKKSGVVVSWDWLHAASSASAAKADSVYRPAFASRVKPFGRQQSSIHGLVIHMEDGKEVGGLTMEIIATVSGSGDSGTVKALGKIGDEMNVSLDEAVRAVKLRYPKWADGHVDISWADKYSDKNGGSAGGAFGVLLLSLLEGFTIDPQFAMTGDITVDWKLRAIGGVDAKIRGATVDGCTVVSIPSENSERINDLAILDGPSALWSIQIFSADTLMDAVHLARTDRDSALAGAIAEFADAQPALKKGGLAYARSPEGHAKLQHIIELAPNHLSAGTLLAMADQKAPTRLSLAMSIYQVLSVAQPWNKVLTDDSFVPAVNGFNHTLTDEALRKLRGLRGKVNTEALPLVNAMSDFISVCSEMAAGSRDQNSLKGRREKVAEALSALSTKRENIEKLLRDGV